MQKMVSGQTANGKKTRANWNESSQDQAQTEPVEPITTQASGPCSEQGSSDEPVEFDHDNEDNVTVQQQTQGRVPPSRGERDGQRNSDATYPTSQSSGSKRKSNDDAVGEGSTRRQKFLTRARRQQEVEQRILETGAEIARTIKSNGANDIMARCLDRVLGLGLEGKQLDFIMEVLDHRLSIRHWIPRATDPQIVAWVNKHCPLDDDVQIPKMVLRLQLITNVAVMPVGETKECHTKVDMKVPTMEVTNGVSKVVGVHKVDTNALVVSLACCVTRAQRLISQILV